MKERTKFRIITGILVVCILALLIVLASVRSFKDTQPKEGGQRDMDITWVGDDESDTTHGNERILIPGVSKLTFIHDADQQSAHFYNPTENTAIMEIRLQLEDGTVLWESPELLPGESINTIRIKNMPSVGCYHAFVVTDCKDQNGNALNGGIVNIILNIE